MFRSYDIHYLEGADRHSSAVRRRFGVTKGTRFTVETDEAAGRIILIPITREYVERLRGRFRGKALLAACRLEADPPCRGLQSQASDVLRR